MMDRRRATAVVGLLALLAVPAASLALAAACGPSARPPAPARPVAAPPAPPAPASARPDPEPWRAARPAPAAGSQIHYPDPVRSQLPNGMTLLVVQRPAPVVALAVVARSGAGAVPAGKSGLAALTARMMTEATRHRASLALAEAAESLGSSLEHDAGRDSMRVGLTVLRADLEPALDLLSEVVREPAFDAKDLDRVRAEWISGLVAERQNPARMASLIGLRALLGDPHGAPVRGTVGDVQKLRPLDLRRFHGAAFVPKNAALVVVGDVAPAPLADLARRSFGGWRGGAAPEDVAFEPPAAPERTRVLVADRAGAVQTAIFATQPFPRRDVPGWEARELLMQVTGGLFTSRLNQNLREKHAWTYGAGSSAAATRQWGAVFVSTSVERSVTADALAEIVRELGELRAPTDRPIQAAELARARADLANAHGAQLEDVGRVAADVAELYVHSLAANHLSTLPARVAAVPGADVQGAASALLPERLLVVVVGDRASIEADLRGKGFAVETAEPKLWQ